MEGGPNIRSTFPPHNQHLPSMPICPSGQSAGFGTSLGSLRRSCALAIGLARFGYARDLLSSTSLTDTDRVVELRTTDAQGMLDGLELGRLQILGGLRRRDSGAARLRDLSIRSRFGEVNSLARLRVSCPSAAVPRPKLPIQNPGAGLPCPSRC